MQQRGCLLEVCQIFFQRSKLWWNLLNSNFLLVSISLAFLGAFLAVVYTIRFWELSTNSQTENRSLCNGLQLISSGSLVCLFWLPWQLTATFPMIFRSVHSLKNLNTIVREVICVVDEYRYYGNNDQWKCLVTGIRMNQIANSIAWVLHTHYVKHPSLASGHKRYSHSVIAAKMEPADS